MPLRDPTSQGTMLGARETLERAKGNMLMMGVGAVVVGIIAVALPYSAALVTGYAVGAVILVAGVVQALRAIPARREGRVFGRIATGTAGILASGVFLAWPRDAVAAFTLAFATVLLAHLTARAVCLWRDDDGRWASRALGAAVLVATVAGVLLAGWPPAGLWTIGTAGGLAMFAAGFWLIRVGTAHDTNSSHDLAGKWPRS